MLLTAVNVQYLKISYAHAGLLPANFTVLSDFFISIEIILCLPYRYFNELSCVILRFLGFKANRLNEIFQLVRGLSHHSHHWIILAPQASIIRQPQGFCF